MASKANEDNVGGDEERAEEIPKSPVPEPGTEAPTSMVAQVDNDDKENSSVSCNCQFHGREVALPGSGSAEALASPLKVTAYFNQLAVDVVRNRFTEEQFMALCDKVEEALDDCGY